MDQTIVASIKNEIDKSKKQLRKRDQVTQQTINTDSIEATRSSCHPDCFVCNPHRPFGLKVQYESRREGGVEAIVSCPETWEGYRGLVHGGIIASLLDGAMTNCLFVDGIVAVTADLHVRFRHPLHLHRSATITAKLDRQSPPLYVVHARIIQDDQVKATSVGKFMQNNNHSYWEVNHD